MQGRIAPMIQRSYTVALSFPSVCVLTGLIGSIKFQKASPPLDTRSQFQRVDLAGARYRTNSDSTAGIRHDYARSRHDSPRIVTLDAIASLEAHGPLRTHPVLVLVPIGGLCSRATKGLLQGRLELNAPSNATAPDGWRQCARVCRPCCAAAHAPMCPQ